MGRTRRWWISALFGAGVVLVAGGAQASGGALDQSFGSAGKVLTSFGNVDEGIAAVLIQGDGRIVAVGSSPPRARGNFLLARYMTRGNLDPSFGKGGKVQTDFGGSQDVAQAAALQTDGRIVVAGRRLLARYTSSGKLDPSFGTGGKVRSTLDAFAVAVQVDGKIVTAGEVAGFDGFALVRHTTDGALDPGFGVGGTVRTKLAADDSDIASALAIQKDGKILAAGSSPAGPDQHFALVRYTAEGKPDASFGSGGKVVTRLAGANAILRALAVQADGKIVTAGCRNCFTGRSEFALARYAPNGALDRRFGRGGRVLTKIGPHDDGAHALVIQADGRILVAGYSIVDRFGNDFALLRYTTSGGLDRSFGTGGKVLTNLGTKSNDIAQAIALQKDGRILLAGTSDFRNGYSGGQFALVRYTK